MSALQKLRDKKKMQDLVESTKDISIKKKPKLDYLDESLVSEITDDEENNEFDVEDDFDGEANYDKNEEMNDNVDYVDENVLGEEKATKNHAMDNNIIMERDIILSVHFKNISKQFNIPDEDNRFDVQRSINSFWYKTTNKSGNDEIVLTAIQMLSEYNNFIRITNINDYITALINSNYLKFLSIATSSFIKTSTITNHTDIHHLYTIIFKNANDFLEKLSGRKTVKKIISDFDVRVPNVNDFINPPMNPDLIRFREFDKVLFSELHHDMGVANEYRYAPLLNNFVSIINSSLRSNTINWDKNILTIQNAPEITDIPILIRKMISIKRNKFSNFLKDDLIQILIEDPNLIKNIQPYLSI